MEMFMDTSTDGIQIIFINTQKVNKYFIGILNSWTALPTVYTKFNVQQIKLFYSIQ